VDAAIAQVKQGLMEWAFHLVALHKAITQFGVAMAAQVVDGVNAIFEFEDRNVLPFGGHSDACAFKQIGLGGHVNPLGHDQMG
jgi:hypothetical protein